MKNGVYNFWLNFAGITCLWVVLILWAAVKFPAIAVILALAAIVLQTQHLANIKTALVQTAGSSSVQQPVSPEELQDLPLDWEKLDYYTQAFQDLGFQLLMDSRISTTPSLARLFVHPLHGCFAEVGQLVLPDKPCLMQCSIISYLQPDWSLATTDRSPNSISFMWRHPRKLGLSLPETAPAELLQHHLDLRQQLMTGRNLTLLTELTWEFWQRRQAEAASVRREIMSRRPILLSLWDALRFELRPQMAWWGEYQPAKPKG